uniref:Pentacotripeptide-repeat region of PRORP domain-containing protein n=1 Tax=Lactuca sativa TaxID=4236 RepID=A0A9R1WMR6_LACSA|nr:hypothetical protein LSAT_V11C100021470 [Lactuca sativa]
MQPRCSMKCKQMVAILTSKTWTILIKGHCSANEVDKALIIFANMIEKGCEADADLLDVLVNGFLSQNKAIEAHQVLVEMTETRQLQVESRTQDEEFKKVKIISPEPNKDDKKGGDKLPEKKSDKKNPKRGGGRISNSGIPDASKDLIILKKDNA